jgi:hypothetical protein
MAHAQRLHRRTIVSSLSSPPTATAIIFIKVRLCSSISPLNSGRSAGSIVNSRS